jgi:hypothetical protein
MLEEGQLVDQPGAPATALLARREHGVDVLVLVHRQGDLLEIAEALRATRRFPRRLYGRQQQGQEHADDRDDDQELDQGEGSAQGAHRGGPPGWRDKRRG